ATGCASTKGPKSARRLAIRRDAARLACSPMARRRARMSRRTLRFSSATSAGRVIPNPPPVAPLKLLGVREGGQKFRDQSPQLFRVDEESVVAEGAAHLRVFHLPF